MIITVNELSAAFNEVVKHHSSARPIAEWPLSTLVICGNILTIAWEVIICIMLNFLREDLRWKNSG